MKIVIDNEIIDKYNIELLILLGSFGTKGFKNGESDIDIAFLSSLPIGERYLEFINDISRALKYSKIDLIDLQKSSGLLKFEVANKGRLIFEKEKGFFVRYQLYCYRYYYDTKKFRNLRKEYFEERLGGIINGKS